MSKNNWKFETQQIHVGQEVPDPTTDSRAVPIYQTCAYVFPSSESAADRFALKEEGNIYTRVMNPTTDVFEKRIAALEGGVAALALASGQAATTYAIQNIAGPGDHIISAKTIYGGTHTLFTHTFRRSMGITVSFVDADDPANFEAEIRENTKALFVESVGNPNADLADIQAIADIAHKHGLPLIVDNTFPSPYLFRPLAHGADIVVHSATKFIGGHGTSIGGVIIDGGTFDWAASGRFPGLTEPDPSYHGVRYTEAVGALAYIIKARVSLLRDMGAALAPFHSFLFLQGLETLSLRMERHVENALKVAEYLEAHPQVERVNHPALPGHPHHELYQRYFQGNGCTSIFTVEIRGGAKEAQAFTEKLQLFSMLANVGDVKSLVIHPASTTH
ncbi:MAG: O-acetylhomoserine aminocarboxypropyltransferase/cysteine synthase, partial [Oscillospiraceae bacterium]|nr:O-acetylhomoserine aminocarboxypropyltransferase/cysteine synthase [Oscillospiraceae bacterium]